MLTPNYLWYVSDRIVELYEELNSFAIKDICRRLLSADWQMTETARYQLLNLMQSGVILQDIQEKITEITGKSEKEVADLFKQSAIKSMKYSDALYSKAGYNVLPFASSEKMMNILTATYIQTNGTLRNFTQTIAKATNTEFYRQLDKIYVQIMSGQTDYISAIARAVDQVAKQGIIIDYPSGARISVEAGVRRATVTGINQACCKLEMERMNEFDVDLVIVSQHFGARPSHAEWQGKVYSLSGKTKGYPNFYDTTGYGTGDGLGGWNCRHSFSPFFEGLSKIPPQYDITKNNDIYEKQQKQRQLERNIRTRKRQIENLKSSIESNNDIKVKSELQKRLDIAKNKLKKQNQQYKQYCADNNFKTQNERLRIAKNSQNSLTSVQSSDKLKDIEKSNYIKSKYYNGKATLFNITEERIDKVPLVELDTLSKEQNQKLQQSGKDLLNYMKDDPLGREGLIAYDMNMNEIERHKSNLEKLSVSIPRYNDDCIVIHNHPSGLIFSPNDLEKFSFNDEIRILGAIGNNGNVYYIEKINGFDNNQFDFEFYMIKKKYNVFQEKDYNKDNIFKIIEELFERGEECGFKTYIITNT